ncbi:MAG TPA: DUF899 family protein [Iamia sp.]|nr:DUF899 family protein [Iamia sp.]
MPDAPATPPVVDPATWEAALADLRQREKAATRELDAIAAARRRLPMVALPDYTLVPTTRSSAPTARCGWSTSSPGRRS